MAPRGDRPWLPGSDPMPEPFDWTGRAPPGARAMPEPVLDVLARLAKPGTPLPPGTYLVGVPQNIINSLASCVEGENRLYQLRDEYWRHYDDRHTPAPQPSIEPHGD
jgi:hypothetical protein